MKEILIIPDVHGRKFWREAVEKHPDLPRVFLGDYTDPYTYQEGITIKEAVKELEDIVELKMSEPDLTTLLLGNHCTHYLWDEADKGTRYDETWKDRLIEIYGRTEFKVAHQVGSYLFTHAGLVPRWFTQNDLNIPEKDGVADFLNSLSQTKKGRVALGNIGRSRGGYSPYGGPLWADWYNDHTGAEICPGLKQIFGHTQVWGPDTLGSSWCIDCKKAFILNIDDGTIKEA